jgi:hypothetical protein
MAIEYATKDNLVDMIDKHLVEGVAMRADLIDDQTRYEFMPIADMVDQIAADRFLVHGFVMRPGVTEFMGTIEHSHYPVASPRNDLLQHWSFRLCGGVWVAITIPSADESIAVDVARANGLLLEDKLPWIILNGRDVEFPIRTGKHLVMTAGKCLYGFRAPSL